MGSRHFIPLVLAMFTIAAWGDTETKDRPHFHASNMEFVAHIPTGTVAADVWAHRGYAYVGSRACGEGVSIIDARDPVHARLMGRLPADNLSRYEDVVVLSVDTAPFRGDLLATGVQPCPSGTKRGVHLWDLTDPANPVELAFFETGNRASVHELSARQVGERLFLYLATPFSELYNEGGDFRILDATDPRKPVQVSDWGVYSRLNLNDRDLRVLSRPVVYCHSVSVSDDGRYAFLSYWDAGYITLDIADPANPVFLSRTEYQADDEGNAHSVFPIMNRNLLLAADEDYLIGGARMEILTPEKSLLNNAELPFAKPACSMQPAEAELVFVGQGCSRGALPAIAANIAVFDAGGCTYYEKALNAQQAGAIAFIAARTAGARADSGNEPITIPGVTISSEDLNFLRASRNIVRAQIGPNGDTTWGYLRIFDIANLAEPRQIGAFATENTKRCPVKNAGWYSVHNPVVSGDIAYMSWYSDGVRAIDISDATSPVEIGSFVIGGEEHSSAGPARVRKGNGRREHVEDGEGEPESFVWGVVVHDGLIYLTDEATGLWVIRLADTKAARLE